MSEEMIDGVNYPGKGIRNFVPTHVIVVSIAAHDGCKSGTLIITPSGEVPIDDVAKKDIPTNALSWKIAEVGAVPTDDYFRDAWDHNDGVISVNMPKALSIHQDQLRKLREPKFKDLDVQFMKALESGNPTDRLNAATKKQELRDVTQHPSVLNATTAEELKSAIPDCLK